MPPTLRDSIRILKKIQELMAGESGGDENLGPPRLKSQEIQVMRYLWNRSALAPEEIRSLEERARDLQNQPRGGGGEDEDDFISEMHELNRDITSLKRYFQIE